MVDRTSKASLADMVGLAQRWAPAPPPDLAPHSRKAGNRTDRRTRITMKITDDHVPKSTRWPRHKPIPTACTPTLTRASRSSRSRPTTASPASAWAPAARSRRRRRASEADADRRGPDQHRAALAQDVGPQADRPPRHDDSRHPRHRHRPLGHQGEGREPAALQAARRLPRQRRRPTSPAATTRRARG